jgi:hypothetical protein
MKIQSTIAGEWASLEATVFTDNVSPMQRREMRRAFYSGAASLMAMIMMGLDPGDDATAADVSCLEGWREELERFSEDLQAGRA